MGMLEYVKQKAEDMKRKVEKRRLTLLDAGACFKVPVLCVLVLGLTAVSLCGCGKLSGGINLFQKENEIEQEDLQEKESEVSTVGENSELVEETDNNETKAADKSYADMLEKKSEEDIRAYFENVSKEAEDMEKNGYVILQWDEVLNLDRYWIFEEKYLAGEPADLILVQYTEDELPYFDYLYFTGSNVVHFRKLPDGEDSSPIDADEFASEVNTAEKIASGENQAGKIASDENQAEKIASDENQADEIASDANVYEMYDYLHTFVQRAEERDRYKTLVLSNEKDLTYQEFETLFYQEEPAVQTEFVASFFYVEE